MRLLMIIRDLQRQRTLRSTAVTERVGLASVAGSGTARNDYERRIGGFASLEAASWPARQGYLYFTVCKTAGARRTANQ